MEYEDEPIYPCKTYRGDESEDHIGLTRLEHFTGLAMQAFASSPSTDWNNKKIACESVKLAREILKELREMKKLKMFWLLDRMVRWLVAIVLFCCAAVIVTYILFGDNLPFVIKALF